MRRTYAITAAAVGIVAATVGLCAALDAVDPYMVIVGTLNTRHYIRDAEGIDCTPTGHLPPVIVTDGGRTVLSIGRNAATGTLAGDDCAVPFAVDRVPRGLAVYGITAGDSNTIRLREDELHDLHLDVWP